MNIVAKILNTVALNTAKSNQSKCAIIGFDEPKMPDSMLK